ncbi:Putative signal transducing protein [Tenacibaculum sp. MAR_2009_124]|uniref:putative signal transducing protein n=1 Tax=Tenacibaculum sp. MAR_2009_124 TaxID=1250059 RepID=UPI000897E872|nr:DUF2007 domain-containing protein [Tenacibaculum sp. MAR_2009_124]SED04998.1 Putative signal transducing protein [Tenacibaculum sp. MAR_2009_124]
MEEYIRVYTGSGILINRLASLLKENDSRFIIKDEKESARLAGFGTTGDSVELHILNTDLEGAKNIIENFTKEIGK